MTSELSFRNVLTAYTAEFWPSTAEHLGGAGGLSGARFWRLSAPAGDLCLRQWPAKHPSLPRLQYIHSVLQHVSGNGCRAIPVPFRTVDARSIVEHNGQLWELTPWMPGHCQLDISKHPQRLATAMESLAEFHQAADSIPGASSTGQPPGLIERSERVARLLSEDASRLQSAVNHARSHPVAPIGNEILSRAAALAEPMADRLRQAMTQPTNLQPCIRDARPEHFLFTGDAITGLVNFGAMREDSVAADLARALGGWAQDRSDLWRIGLNAYQQRHPLDAWQHQLVQLYDESNVVVSGINWLRWLLVEQREFERRDLVQARLLTILQRLRHLTSAYSRDRVFNRVGGTELV